MLIILFLSVGAQAYELGLGIAGRSYVRGLSAEVSLKEEQLIWGEKTTSSEDWKYGFVQAQAAAATHGQVSAGLSLFPISFIEMNYKQSWTQRYSASSVFGCGTNQCFGSVVRKIYTGRMALAYKAVIVFYSTSSSFLAETNGAEPIVDELENLLINPAGDIGVTRTLLLGMRGGEQAQYTWGLLYRDFEYQHSRVKNEMFSLVFRKKTSEAESVKGQWFVTAGTYRSTFSNEGLSLGLGRSWQWGESLSLF